MKQLRRLLKFISFVIFCIITDINSAQVNIAGINYTFGPVGGNNMWHNVGGTDRLTSQMLRDHLNGMPVANTLRELSGMLLAQIPAGGGIGFVGPHNVAGNNASGYTIAAKAGGGHNCDDIHISCKLLKEHMLNHGHLGYFPMLSHKDHSGVSNHLIARGIFNISHTIIDRIFNFQLNIFKRINNFLNRSWYNRSYFWLPINVPVNHPMYNARYSGWVQINSSSFHLLPNLLNNLGFKVDPAVSRNEHPNLEDATNNLINHLLSTNYILNIVVGAVNNNRFTLDVTYTFSNPIPDTTQTKDIGYKMDGTVTNTVKIVVQVQNGIISIVTMYPI